jgi:hypothetical protein
MSVYCCKLIFHYRLSPESFGYTLVLESEGEFCHNVDRTLVRSETLPTAVTL